jgi:NADP-dependent 3-hydroxy acid dehydrogenase YdfG
MSVQTVVIADGSSDVGVATARVLVARGFNVVVGAPSLPLCRAIADEVGVGAFELDISSDASVSAMVRRLGEVAVFVNNSPAYGGMELSDRRDVGGRRASSATNVRDALRLTRAVLTRMGPVGDMLIVTITPRPARLAERDPAPPSAVQQALLRMVASEFDPTQVRLTEVEYPAGELRDDAMAHGGSGHLGAVDIAEVIAFAATRPATVSLDRIVVGPRVGANLNDKR